MSLSNENNTLPFGFGNFLGWILFSFGVGNSTQLSSPFVERITDLFFSEICNPLAEYLIVGVYSWNSSIVK